MKSLLKFAALAALLISGKLAKQPMPAVMVRNEAVTSPENSVVLVHQVLTSEPVLPAQKPTSSPNGGSGLLAELF